MRIWVGFGVMRVEDMLRLQIDENDVVNGSLLVHFRVSNMAPEDAEEIRSEILKGCRDWKQGVEKETCFAEFERPPNWKRLHAKLERLGIYRLPDESELPRLDFTINDGIAMVVELRDGDAYRAYAYSNPIFRSEPEAKAAYEIMKALSSVYRKAKTAR